MADTIQLQRNSRPWQPSQDVELVETLHFHDVPLVGIVRQHNVDYLFACLEGPTSRIHFWAYVLLTPSDLEVLAAAEPGAPVREVVMELLTKAPMVLAGASDEHGILGWAAIDGLHEVELGLTRIVQDVKDYLEQIQDELKAMRGLAKSRA